MPFPYKRLVKRLPLPMEPDRAAGKTFLAKCIDGNNVVAASLFARIRVGEGEPCLRQGCPGTIRRITQGGRSTYYCPVCQR